MNESPTGIILVFLEQFSARWLEASGERLPLPNVRRLQQMGTTFSNDITSNPVCCASRATVAIGLTSRQHGLLENGYQLDPVLPTFMRTLQGAGWRTGVFGKVHFHPHFAAYGPGKVNLRDRIEEIRSSFQWASDEFPVSEFRAYALPFPEEVSQTAWITSHALDFLRDLPAGQSFMAQFSYVQPHSPYCPPAEYLRQVGPDMPPEPVPAEWREDPHAPAYFDGKLPSGGNWRHIRRCYFADLLHLDRQLGILFDQLEATDRLDSTSILLLADHGDLLGYHGCYGKEERHYDACIRVPLIIAGPGVKADQTRHEMVQLEDVFPSVLDLAGLRFPPMPKTGPYLSVDAADIPQLSGRSLLPLCQGETPIDWRQAAYSESYNRITSSDPGALGTAQSGCVHLQGRVLSFAPAAGTGQGQPYPSDRHRWRREESHYGVEAGRAQ